MSFTVGEEVRELQSDDWLFLDGSELHALEALADTVVLVTILLTAKS